VTSRSARTTFAAGAVSFALGLSIKSVLDWAMRARLAELDEAVLRNVAAMRTGWLNATAVDFTALGSGVLLALATVIVGVMLLSTRDWFGAFHLGLAGLGAMILTTAFKAFFARPRPSVVDHLVHVSATGFSYPSGHALGTAACYFSFALIARRHLPRHVSREILIAFALSMIVLVSASRVYLGVHYMSDVVAGVLVGVGWSLMLAGGFASLDRTHPVRLPRISEASAEE
jgi:membrane-associated phospholipid phosphatase